MSYVKETVGFITKIDHVLEVATTVGTQVKFDKGVKLILETKASLK